MQPFELWLYRGAVVILLGFIWWYARRIIKRLDMLNNLTAIIEKRDVARDGVVKRLQDKTRLHDDKLEDHEKRLREVEKKQDRCDYCPDPA
jgi:hypothetical protein